MKCMHLRQPGFTYSVCRPFTKNKERIQKFKITGDSRYIYQNEIDKACFQHVMAHGDFKKLPRRTASDKSGGGIKNEIMPNKDLAEELNKPIIRKFEKRKVHSSYIDNI